MNFKEIKMMNLKKNRISFLSVCLVAGLFTICFNCLAQEKSDEDLKKEYAPILGEYAFDSLGEAFTLKFYIEEGALWADSGDGRPATMKPIEDEVFSFTAEDPISGVFRIKFLKDDQGEYTLCHVVNEDMGLETEGIKIK
jgi:hypothetical protein